jgi:CRP/FNR family transcriptional regulator
MTLLHSAEAQGGAFPASPMSCPVCQLLAMWPDGTPHAATLPQSVRRQSLRRHATLFQAGAPFRYLYGVHAGQFKTFATALDGRQQVAGFHMTGDLLGFDGIGAGTHACDAVALEDSRVCPMPYDIVAELAGDVPVLERWLCKLMSHQIVRDQRVMSWLGGMKADARLANFLLDMLARLQAHGFSGVAMILRMTREEIGSHLGLKLETVSRVFSRFQQAGLLTVNQRDVRILDLPGLQQVGGQRC